MGWFDEQIRQRMESDQNVLEDSFFRMANVVLDKWGVSHLQDERLVTREAMDDILKYYRKKTSENFEEAKNTAEQLSRTLRSVGLMSRGISLEKGWYHDAFGPILARMKNGGPAVALMPGTVYGYWYKDPSTGKKTRISRKTENLFEEDALCFYDPLPMKKLGIPDLLFYMKDSISGGDLILIVLATLAVILVGFIEPQVYSLITGTVLKEKKLNMMAGLMIFLVSSAFATQLLKMVRDLLMNRINTKTSIAVEASVMMRILSLPAPFFRKFSAGELASRSGSVSMLCTMMLNNVLSVGLSSVMSLLYITQIFHFAPALALPSVLIILSTAAVSLAASFMQIGVSRKKMDLDAKTTGMGYAMLNGIQKIKLAGAEKRSFARWGRLYADKARLEYNPPLFLKVNRVFVTGISLVGTIVLYYLAVRTGVTESQYYAFSASYGKVMAAFSALAGIAISIASIPPVLEMAEPILKTEPEVTGQKEIPARLTGSIEMSHISFRYEENTPYILKDLSLKVKAGEYIAIVGRTGCGKSTLVRLLLGFEKPEKGSIFYDRYDLASLDPRSVRKQIGVVIQNGQLFQGDIFSNITISAPELSLAEAWKAAETAGIAEDIQDMPMGMQTIISEGQGGISGGQKQRLLIARAIAPKPGILIFDEATSALDNKTQKQVSDALDQLRCTRIVIAHRLSTVRNCDRILVMDQGNIIEEGTYEQLIEKGGVFADLVARQRLDIQD